VIIDCSAAGLDNVDILSSHRVLYLTARLAAREFGKNTVAWGNPKDVAYAVHEGRMRVARKDNNISDHLFRSHYVLQFVAAVSWLVTVQPK
jgi:hypothetical protein